MFKEFLYPLVDRITFFNIFQYISFRGAYAVVTALLISFLMGPKVIEKLRVFKFGQQVRKDGPETHLKKQGTPSMGGLLILASLAVSVLLWQDFHNLYTWLLLGSALGFGFLGFLDDYLKIKRKNSDGLQARLKFIGQTVLAVAVVLILYFFGDEEITKLYIPFFKNPVWDMGWIFIPFGILYIVGLSNAVNLTDGLDGLATGLMVIMLIAVIIITYLTGHIEFADYLRIPYIAGTGEIVVVLLALLGACVGFLWFNCHPAEVMMGDTGSLSMGALLGVLGLIIKKEILFLIIGGVFVIETASVIIQVAYFKRTGKRAFRMAPIHHHFELLGWDESKVVTRLYILGGLLAIVGPFDPENPVIKNNWTYEQSGKSF